MKERNVSSAQVERTVRHPDHVEQQATGRLCAERRTSDGGRVRVIYEFRDDSALGEHIIVVTAIRD
jgi:hypothetical protein